MIFSHLTKIHLLDFRLELISFSAVTSVIVWVIPMQSARTYLLRPTAFKNLLYYTHVILYIIASTTTSLYYVIKCNSVEII